MFYFAPSVILPSEADDVFIAIVRGLFGSKVGQRPVSVREINVIDIPCCRRS